LPKKWAENDAIFEAKNNFIIWVVGENNDICKATSSHDAWPGTDRQFGDGRAGSWRGRASG
jgi:hypothetical protein